MSNPKVQDPEIVDDAAPLPIPLAPSHGPAVPLVASHRPSATTTGNPFNKGPLAPRQKKEPEGLQSTGGGKIGSLTSSTATSVGGVKDLLGRTVASAGESLFSTLGLPQKAAKVWDRVKQEHPVFADLVGRSAPGMNLGLDLALKTVGPMLPEKDFVTPVIKAADETLERLGVHKDTAMGQVGETVGGISGGVTKASVLGPVALPFFAVEGGIDKTVQALDEGSSLNKSLAAGTVNALTAATIMKLAGGNPKAGEAVYNSFLKLAAKKAATGTGMGTAFGATDLAIDKFILNKNMTWGQAGHSMLSSIKTMLGYELAGGIKPARMLFEGKQIAGQYASPEDAHADIVPKLVDAYASGDKKEIDRQYAKHQAVVYAQQAGIPFKGAKAVSGAEQIPHALRVVEASKPTEEATNASEVEGTTPVGEQPGGAQGPGGEGREGVGQGVEGEASPGEGEAPKEKGKTLDEMAPTIPAALKDRFQEDVAAGKRHDADLADLEAEAQRREGIFRKKIKQRVFAAKGGKGKPPSEKEIDAFIQRDAKSKDEHDAIQSRKVFIEVQREANEKAREATAEKWRKVVPETQGQEPEAEEPKPASEAPTAVPEAPEENPEPAKAEEPVRAPEKKEEPKVEKRVKGEKVKVTSPPPPVIQQQQTPAAAAPGTGAPIPAALQGKRRVGDTFFMDPSEMVVDPEPKGTEPKDTEAKEPVAEKPKAKTPFKKEQPKPEEPKRPVTVQAERPLPKELSSAKPRFNVGMNSYLPVFENPIDKALFIVAQKTPSKSDAKYMDWLRSHFPENSDEEIRSMGSKVRGEIKRLAKGEAGTIAIPDQGHAENPGEVKITPRAKAKEKVQETLPGDENSAARHQAYQNGVTPDSSTEDIVAAAVTPPKSMVDPERGAVSVALPDKADVGKVLETIWDRIKDGFKGLGPSPNDRVRKATAMLNMYESLAKANRVQMPFIEGRPDPEVASSMIGGRPPLLEKDSNVSVLGQSFRSPHFLGPGERAYIIDRIIADSHEASLTDAHSRVVRDTLKKEGIKDDSEMIDKRMSPLHDEITKLVRRLAPLTAQRRGKEAELLKQRQRVSQHILRDMEERAQAMGKKLDHDDLLKAMDKAEKAPEVQAAKSDLALFGSVHQQDMEADVIAKNGLYDKAQKEIRDIAKVSPDTRVALWMEPEAKRPYWLEEMMKPNEIRAAERLTELNAKFRDAGKKVGLAMRNEEYITHLFRPMEAYLAETTAEGRKALQEVLDFQHRDDASMNLMPSVHAAMSYYIPTISRKLARQPLLNKWMGQLNDQGQNAYQDPNSKFYAKNFGDWLEREIKEMQYPPHPDVVDRTLGWIKQAEMTKLLAANPRVGVKHAVSKLANNLAFHRSYTAPAMGEYMVNLARRAENLPLIGTAFKNTTGRVLDLTGHLSAEDQAKVQILMSNLVQRRQIMAALNEDPLMAKYQQPLFNSFFGHGARGMAENVFKGARKVKRIAGFPVSQIEAMENFVNVAASLQRGQDVGLSQEDQIRGAIGNILDISQRGGADASRFTKSKVGALTALTQTPSKMYELYAQTIKRAVKGEKDIYGTTGATDLISMMAVHGALIALGEKSGKMVGKRGLKLYHMLYHPPAMNPEVASKYAQYAYHEAMAHSGVGGKQHEREALRLKLSGDGDIRNLITLSTIGDIGSDIKNLSNAPMAFAKGLPAVQQWAALAGKVPHSYESKLHYLAGVKSEDYEKRMENLSVMKGKKEYLNQQRKAKRPLNE